MKKNQKYIEHIYIYLIEADGIEAKAEIEKTNGDAIEEAEENNSFRVYWFILKEVQSICHMKCAICYHQMPTC